MPAVDLTKMLSYQDAIRVITRYRPSIAAQDHKARNMIEDIKAGLIVQLTSDCLGEQAMNKEIALDNRAVLK